MERNHIKKKKKRERIQSKGVKELVRFRYHRRKAKVVKEGGAFTSIYNQKKL